MTIVESGLCADYANPEKYGFERLEVTPLSEEDTVKVYLHYLETGGTPIPAWERILAKLEDAGRLALIREEFRNQE